MKKRLLIAMLFAFTSIVPAWSDTEIVNGIEWHYRIEDDHAIIENQVANIYFPAIDESTRGEVVIPNELGGCPVTGLGYGAFGGCNLVTKITIPATITDIDSGSVFGCTGMTAIAVADANPNYKSVNRMLLTKDGTSLIAGVNGEMMIPGGVTSIGSGAFMGLDGLISVRIPESVTEIDDYSFYMCGNLKTFYVEADNSSYKSENGLLLTKDGSELVCGVAGDVRIPEGVSSIRDIAFYGRSGLLSVRIPASVCEIGAHSFAECAGIRSFVVDGENENYRSVNGLLLTKDGSELLYGVRGSVTIPSGVTRIGADAFSGCRGMSSLTIPEGVTEIGEAAFYHNDDLVSVTIPASVTDIHESTFWRCGGLKSISVHSDNPNYRSANGLLLSQDGTKLVAGVNGDVTIPAGVSEIGACAFFGRGALTSVSIPFGVVKIVSAAFCGCAALTSVSIPSSVTEFDGWAFYNCTGLRTASVPNEDWLKSDAMFANCCRLREIRLQTVLDRSAIGTVWSDLKTASGLTVRSISFDGEGAVVSLEAKTSFVRFDATGGTCAESEREVESDAAVGTLPTPTRPLYLFKGWYTAKSGGSKISESTPVTADTTYYAHWKKDGKVYVEAAVDASCAKGGTASGGNGRFAVNSTVTLTATAKTGYYFSGWYKGNTKVYKKATYPYKVIGEDVSLVVKFTYDPVAFDEQDDVELDVGESFSVALVCESKTAVTYKTSGLPSGVTFDAKTLTVSGKVAKAGAYTVKITGTNKSGSVASVSFVLNVGHLKLLTVTAYTDDDAKGGKVSGGGYYEPGKKVTLKATAYAGWVFAGWSGLDESRISGDVDLRTAKIAYVTGDDEEEILAYFVPAADDKASLGVSLKTPPYYDSNMDEWVGYTDFTGDLSVGVMTTQQLAVTSLSLPTLTVTGLPKGLKFNASTYEIYGVPTKAGSYTMKATASNLSGAKKTVSFAVKVTALPKWAYGSYLGSGYLRTYSSGDSRLSDYCGPMAVNVSGVGKLSGYFLFSGKRYSFAKTGYDNRVYEVIRRCPQCGNNVTTSRGGCTICQPVQFGYYCDSCQTQIDESDLLVSTNVYFKASVPVKVGSRIFQVPLTVAAYGNSSPEFGCEGLGCVSCDSVDSIPLLATTNPRDSNAYGWVAMAQSLVGRSDVATLPAKTLKKWFVGEEDDETLGEGDWLTVKTYSTGKTLTAGRIGGNAVSWSSEFVPGEIGDESFSGRSYLYAAPVKRTGFLGRFMAYELNVDRGSKTVEAGDLWNASWE